MSKRRKIVLIVGGAFISLCACLSILVAIAPDSETETAVSEDVRVEEIDISEDTAVPEEIADAPEPSETPVSTEAPEPTVEPTETAVPPPNTPKPTRTPKPTNTPVPQVEISAASVNVRGGPGTDYDSIGSLARGNIVHVVAQTNDASWYVVELDNGTMGWVGAGATTAVSAAAMNAIPVAATIPAQPPTQVPATAIPPTAVPPTAIPATSPPQPTSPPAAPTEAPAPTEPPAQSAAQVVITYVNIKNNGGTDQDLSG